MELYVVKRSPTLKSKSGGINHFIQTKPLNFDDPVFRNTQNVRQKYIEPLAFKATSQMSPTVLRNIFSFACVVYYCH